MANKSFDRNLQASTSSSTSLAYNPQKITELPAFCRKGSAEPEVLSLTRAVMPIVQQWLLNTLEPVDPELDPNARISREDVYALYYNFSEKSGLKTLPPSSVGKMVKATFPQIKIRRLGTKKGSKYHYSGVRLRPGISPPTARSTSPTNSSHAVYPETSPPTSPDPKAPKMQEPAAPATAPNSSAPLSPPPSSPLMLPPSTSLAAGHSGSFSALASSASLSNFAFTTSMASLFFSSIPPSPRLSVVSTAADSYLDSFIQRHLEYASMLAQHISSRQFDACIRLIEQHWDSIAGSHSSWLSSNSSTPSTSSNPAAQAPNIFSEISNACYGHYAPLADSLLSRQIIETVALQSEDLQSISNFVTALEATTERCLMWSSDLQQVILELLRQEFSSLVQKRCAIVFAHMQLKLVLRNAEVTSAVSELLSQLPRLSNTVLANFAGRLSRLVSLICLAAMTTPSQPGKSWSATDGQLNMSSLVPWATELVKTSEIFARWRQQRSFEALQEALLQWQALTTSLAFELHLRQPSLTNAHVAVQLLMMWLGQWITLCLQEGILS